MKLSSVFTSIFALGIPLGMASCSKNLTKADLEGIPLTTEKYSFFGNIPLVLGADTLQLSQDLLRAYTAAADPKIYPREQCRGTATIKANIENLSQGSAMALGIAIFPLWPLLPVDEKMTYQLTTRIYCNGTLVKHIEFTEEDRVKATIYGRFRSDLVNKASKQMHRKLIQRMTYELGSDRPADQNVVSDYSI